MLVVIAVTTVKIYQLNTYNKEILNFLEQKI